LRLALAETFCREAWTGSARRDPALAHPAAKSVAHYHSSVGPLHWHEVPAAIAARLLDPLASAHYKVDKVSP